MRREKDMNYYKDNCKHFRYIYKVITGIDGSMNHVKVRGNCLIDKMANRECPKDENCFEEVYHLALNHANA